MKIKDGFVLKEIGGEQVAIPLGGDLNLSMMITLNPTGCTLWKKLENEVELSELADALVEEYGIDQDTATEHAKKFVEKLKKNDFLE